MAMHVRKQEKTEAEQKKSKERRGFYLALAVCLAAIGIAAWSTYDTVSGFLEPEPVSESSAPSAAPRPTPETALSADDDPEAGVEIGHAQETAPEVSVQTPEAEPESEAAAAPPEDTETEGTADAAEEAAAEVSYTVSETMTPPVLGEVLERYSDTPVYSETMRDYRAHSGIDYAAAHGETVHACANGLVKETYTDMLRGNMIVIEHGGYEVRYCGLGETFLVQEGDVVEAGQDIGSVTAAPFESAEDSHLHIEVTKDGGYIDPETVLK